jgi:hypothetical protein
VLLESIFGEFIDKIRDRFFLYIVFIMNFKNLPRDFPLPKALDLYFSAVITVYGVPFLFDIRPGTSMVSFFFTGLISSTFTAALSSLTILTP